MILLFSCFASLLFAHCFTSEFSTALQHLSLLVESPFVILLHLFNEFVPVDQVIFLKIVIENRFVVLPQLLLQEEVVSGSTVIMLVVSDVCFETYSKQSKFFHPFLQLFFIRKRRQPLNHPFSYRNNIICTEFMISDRVYVGSLQRIDLQHYTQYISQLFTSVSRYLINTFLDDSIELRGISMVKGKIPEAHGVQNDAQAPDVCFEGIIPFHFQHFRRCIARTSTGSHQHLSFGVDVAQTKVNDFDIVFIVKKDVFWFEIPVNDSQFMQIFHSIEKLLQVLTGLEFSQFFILDYVLEHFSSTSQLCHQVVIMLIFQDLIKLDDVGVPRFSEDLQLLLQSHFVSFSGDCSLFDHLDCNFFICVDMSSNSHLVEGTLSNSFANEIRSNPFLLIFPFIQNCF